MKNKLIFGIFLAIVFFLIGFLNVSHYGLNVDEPNHFMRGQALLHYLQTGEKTYKNLKVDHRSLWQDDGQNGIFYFNRIASHPTLDDIWAAAFNYVFYQKLGIVGDLETYHLFEIFISSMLVFLVYIMVSVRYGKFSGIVSSLSMALYPLFLGESRFNIKDPVEATFFAFTVYLFFLAINKKKSIYIILSGVFFAFAMGTKFNAAFIPFIFIPYLVIRFWAEIKKNKLSVFKEIPLRTYGLLLLAGLISVLIYWYFNPQLWVNPIKFINEQVAYYKDIGTGNSYQPAYQFFGFNFYPPFFISISTPLVILFLAIVGFYSALKKIPQERDKFSLLIILWFAVPILRTMWPGATIYSGVRQIMEYIPAMAILSGIGASCLVQNLKFKIFNFKLKLLTFVFELLIILSFIPITLKLISLHPNENLYLNPLVGGLKGAVEKKIPGAAESMGNAYLQGIWWLNTHAEKNAHYKLAVSTGTSIPTQFARKDLKMGNYFSGMSRKGEYMMEMQSIDFPPPIYFFQYLDTFFNPVYEVKVDGATILKIWKNDEKHGKKGYLNETEGKDMEVGGGTKDGVITVTLPNPSFITRLEIEYDNKNCIQERSGRITYTVDKKNINYAPDDLSNAQGSYASTLQKDNLFVYFFAAYPAKYIQLFPDDPRSCLLQYKKVNVQILQDIKP